MTAPPDDGYGLDETLPGQDRPPSRWPVRVGAVLVVAALAVGAVAAARGLGDDDPVAAPTPSAPATAPTAAHSTSKGRIISPSLIVPVPVRLAIRAVYPGASTAVVSAIVVRNRLISTHYGARTPRRTLEIEIERDRTGTAQVLRTARALRITENVAGDRVSVRVTTRRGSTTQGDYLALEQLIRDPRLLVTE